MFSSQNGIHPQLTSPTTTFRSGYRSNTPVKIMYVNGVTAEKKRTAIPPTFIPGTSSWTASSARGFPPWFRWNDTTESFSQTAPHSGSYAGSQYPRSGEPGTKYARAPLAAQRCDLRDRDLHGIVDGQRAEPHEAAAVGGLEVVEQPVVVGLHQREPHCAIRDAVGRHRHGGVHDGPVDAVTVHVGEVRSAVVVPRQDLVPRHPVGLVVAVLVGPAGDGLEPERPRRRSPVETPPVATVGTPQHPRRAVAELLREPFHVQILRIDQVVVGRDDSLLSAACLHRGPPGMLFAVRGRYVGGTCGGAQSHLSIPNDRAPRVARETAVS